MNAHASGCASFLIFKKGKTGFFSFLSTTAFAGLAKNSQFNLQFQENVSLRLKGSLSQLVVFWINYSSRRTISTA